MTYSAEVLADSPLLYWKFDETSGTVATDSSGNGHDGTFTGGVTLGSTGLRSGSTSVLFDGTTGYVVSNDTFQSEFTNVTFELLLNPTTGGGTGDLISLSGSSSGGGLLALDNYQVFPTAVFAFAEDASGSTDVSATAGSLAVDTTGHAVFTYDGTDLVVYVNGVAVGSGSASLIPAPNNAQPIYVATESLFAGVNGFKGNISDVAIYTTALSPARVLAHYNAIAGGSSGNFRFTLPTETTVPNVAYDVPPIANALMRYYPSRLRGKAVWHLEDDTISFDQPYPTVFPDAAQHSDLFPVPPVSNWWGSNLTAVTVKVVYYGGHTYIVDTDEEVLLAAFLTAQGYTPGDWLVPI